MGTPTSHRGGIHRQSEGTNRFVTVSSRPFSNSTSCFTQRSLVILSQHPYPSLFYTILSYLGQSFLAHGGPMLEAACHNIANWYGHCALAPPSRSRTSVKEGLTLNPGQSLSSAS